MSGITAGFPPADSRIDMIISSLGISHQPASLGDIELIRRRLNREVKITACVTAAGWVRGPRGGAGGDVWLITVLGMSHNPAFPVGCSISA